MTSSAPRAVLHLTSAPGGGVDRYIRDLAGSVAASHAIWHAGLGRDVVEAVSRQRFWPVPPAHAAVAHALAQLHPLAHLHAVDRRCRDRLALLEDAGPTPFLITLHDVGFLHPDAFGDAPIGAVDTAWVREVTPVLQRAGAVLATSPYIASLVSSWFSGVDVAVVEPGLSAERGTTPALPQSFVERAPQHTVAVVGAIGPHKGSALLPHIAEALHERDAAIVVLGYTDDRITRGWVAPGLFIHGPYEDAALHGWLAAYAPVLALFPNRLPESFSYTLSEVWAAGIPALVPDQGALGQRVAQHGGGWILPAGFDAEVAIDALARLLDASGAAEVARVKSAIVPSDPDQVPTLPAMSSAIAAVYARFGVQTSTADELPAALLDPAWQRLLAANLDGFTFRQELVFLCESLANVEARAQAAAENAAANRVWAERVQAELETAKQWAAKLERDVATLNDEIAHRDGVVKELQDGVEWLRGELARASENLERFARYREELEMLKGALDRLPRWLRERILRRGESART